MTMDAMVHAVAAALAEDETLSLKEVCPSPLPAPLSRAWEVCCVSCPCTPPHRSGGVPRTVPKTRTFKECGTGLYLHLSAAQI